MSERSSPNVDSSGNADRQRSAATLRERPFHTGHLHADLHGRSARGGVVTLSGQAVKFALCLTETVVLARLLAPEAFGLVAMVTAVMGVVAIFRDSGLSMATVQRDNVTHAQISNLFWINLSASGVLALGLAGTAPLIASAYGEPRLTWITWALALAFFLSGASLQHRALLQRQMRFVTMMGIEISAMGSGVAMAIVLATQGAGYWALIGYHLAESAVSFVVTFVVCGWLPGWPRLRSGVYPLLAFGGNLSAAQLLNVARRQSDRILIGGGWGGTALGFYTRAISILYLPIQFLAQPLSTAIVPALSRLQHQPDAYRQLYRRWLMTQVVLTLPVAVFVLVCPALLVRVTLGPQWDKAALILQVAAPAGVAWVFQSGIGWAITPMGRADRQLRCMFVRCGITLAGIGIGAFWGPIGVASGLSVASMATLVPEYALALRVSPVSYRDVFAAVWRPLLTAGLTALLLSIIGHRALPGIEQPFLATGLNGLVFIASYFGLMYLLPGGDDWFGRVRQLSGSLIPARPGRMGPVSPEGA